MKLPFGLELVRTAALEKDRTHREGLWQQTGELTKKLADARDELEICDADRMKGYDLLKECRLRAELAERSLTAAQAHAAALQGSNDKLVQTMMEMRRAGYGLIADVLKEDLQDGAKSVDEEDEDAVKEDPAVAAKELG